MVFNKIRRDCDEPNQLLHAVENQASTLLNIVGILATAVIAYTDWLVVPNISLGYLYLLPIALCALINPSWLTGGVCLFCTFLQEYFGPQGDSIKVQIVRCIISLAGYLIVGFLVTHIARQRECMATEIRRQRDEFQDDLMLAAQVQQRVLPAPPHIPGLDLAAVMHPARLLGGDYYDFFEISPGIVDVVIADVSGKGAAASLLMPSLALALRMRARELPGPAAILADLDRVLTRITNSATFVTMFYARLNPAERTLHYASGGHNPPILLRTRTSQLQLLEEGGPILGILPSTSYTDTILSLEPGDLITLFTDGVTEQEDEQGQEFSVDRLERLVLEKRTQPASDLVTHIADAVAAFAGNAPQTDDFTVVAARLI